MFEQYELDDTDSEVIEAFIEAFLTGMPLLCEKYYTC